MYDRLRALTEEYRDNPEKEARRSSIQRQIDLYQKRINATQTASKWLNVAVISFLGTVFATGSTVIYPNSFSLRLIGILSMVLGVLLLLSAIICELYEDQLSRKALRVELSEFPEIYNHRDSEATKSFPKNDSLISDTRAGFSLGRRS